MVELLKLQLGMVMDGQDTEKRARERARYRDGEGASRTTGA
jgi:hypothetical protein